MDSIVTTPAAPMTPSKPRRAGLLSRTAIAALPAVLLLGLVAGPVSAAKPVPVATANLSNRLCEFVVAYNWSRFSGKRLTATVGLYERTGAGDVTLSEQSQAGQAGRSGSISYGVSLTAGVYPGGHLVAKGSLTDSTGQQVPGSAAESAVVDTDCG